MGGEGKGGTGGMRFALMLVLGVAIGLFAVWFLMDSEAKQPGGSTAANAVAAGKAPLTTHSAAVDATQAQAGPLELGAAGQRIELSPEMAAAAGPLDAAPIKATPLPAGQGAGLSGRVVDRGGRPVEGAKVELKGVRKDQPMAMSMVKTGPNGAQKLQIQGERVMGPETTGPDGRYAFQGLEPGVRWRIEVAPPEKTAGYLPGNGRAPDLVAGQTAQASDVVLSRAASLSGVVLGPDGAPAPGARVLLGAIDGPFAALDFGGEEEETQPVPAPQGKPGQGAGKAEVTVTKQARGMMFSVGGAAGDMFGGMQTIETRADEQGRWRIESAPPGKHALQAQARGKRPAKTEVELEEGREKSGIRLELGEGLVLRVRVVDAAGNAVAKARVLVMDRGGRGVETGPDGKAELPGLATAEAMLMVEAEGYVPFSGPVQVPDASTAAVDIVLKKGATLVGTVLKKTDRTPVDGGNVWLEPLVHGGRLDISMRGDGRIKEGRFKLPGVAPGRWRLHAQHPRLAEVTRDIEVPVATEVVDVGELLLGELGKIAATVVDPSGAPVEGAEVQLGLKILGGGGGMVAIRAVSVETEDDGEGEEEEPPAFRGMGKTLRTDAAGKTTLPGVQPGKTTVQASKDGWAPAYSAEIEVPEDGSTVEVTLRLSPGGRVTGKVRGLSPGAGESVFLLRKNNPMPAGHQQLDGEGAFAFERITPGTYRLSLGSSMKPGGGPAPQWFEVKDEETVTKDLEAEARATLEGSVKDAAGQPVAGADVGLGPLMPPGMGTFRTAGPGGGGATTDSAGRFRLEGLSVVGREQALTVTPRGGEAETFRVVIDRAGTLRKDVTLTGGAGAGELTVDVTLPDGKPAAGEPVELESLDADRPLVRRETPADAQGRAKFAALPPGRYALSAGRAPQARSRVEASVGEAPVQAGTLALVAGGTLAVELAAGGAERASVEVTAPGEPPRYSFTAAGETVRVGGLTPGREYTVSVRSDGFTPFQATVRAQASETPLRVALQPVAPQ